MAQPPTTNCVRPVWAWFLPIAPHLRRPYCPVTCLAWRVVHRHSAFHLMTFVGIHIRLFNCAGAMMKHNTAKWIWGKIRFGYLKAFCRLVMNKLVRWSTIVIEYWDWTIDVRNSDTIVQHRLVRSRNHIWHKGIRELRSLLGFPILLVIPALGMSSK
jgi:hypothetical protein